MSHTFETISFINGSLMVGHKEYYIGSKHGKKKRQKDYNYSLFFFFKETIILIITGYAN